MSLDDDFVCEICGNGIKADKDEWMRFFPRKQRELVICAKNGLECITKYYLDEE